MARRYPEIDERNGAIEPGDAEWEALSGQFPHNEGES